MPGRNDRRRRGSNSLIGVSLERRRLGQWLHRAGGAVRGAGVRVGEHRAHRVGAHLAGAGIHARRVRGAGFRRASRVDVDGPAPRRARARRREAHPRARAASDARPAVGPLHRRDPLRDEAARHAAHRVRLEDRDADPGVRAQARRRVRIPRRPRSLSADADRSADGIARRAAANRRTWRSKPSRDAAGARAVSRSPKRRCQDAAAHDHGRARSRPRRRRSGRDRPARHARKGRDARDRQEAEAASSMRSPACARC